MLINNSWLTELWIIVIYHSQEIFFFTRRKSQCRDICSSHRYIFLFLERVESEEKKRIFCHYLASCQVFPILRKLILQEFCHPDLIATSTDWKPSTWHHWVDWAALSLLFPRDKPQSGWLTNIPYSSANNKISLMLSTSLKCAPWLWGHGRCP